MSLKRIHLVLNLYPAMAPKSMKRGSQTKPSGTEPIRDETYRDITYRRTKPIASTREGGDLKLLVT